MEVRFVYKFNMDYFNIKLVHLEVVFVEIHWQLYPLLVHTRLKERKLSTGYLNIGSKANKYCLAKNIFY